MSAFPKTTTCANIVFPVKRGGRPILANRQLPLAAHRPRAQACARSLARTSRQAGPRASINAPVARHVSPHASTYARTRARTHARGVRHHLRHALLRSCVPSADRRPHGACVTDAHRPVSTHPPWPRRALVRRIGCAGHCAASSVEHTWHSGDPRPTRVHADRTAQLAHALGAARPQGSGARTDHRQQLRCDLLCALPMGDGLHFCITGVADESSVHSAHASNRRSPMYNSDP
jgi:hypothetical protein